MTPQETLEEQGETAHEVSADAFAELSRLFAENEEGHAVHIGDWSGGNDSGCVTLHSLKLTYATEEILEGLVYDCLGYGSWAGEFSAEGNIYLHKDMPVKGVLYLEMRGTETDETSSETIEQQQFDFTLTEEEQACVIEAQATDRLTPDADWNADEPETSHFRFLLKHGRVPARLLDIEERVSEFVRHEHENLSGEWLSISHDFTETFSGFQWTVQASHDIHPKSDVDHKVYITSNE